VNIVEEEKVNTKFNWIALLFGSVYYAGYGKLTKAVICALISFIPLIQIPVNIYLGKKANSELPVGKVPFKWMIAIPFTIVFSIYNYIVITLIQESQSDPIVEMVKGGKLGICPEKTIEEMTKGFMASPNWEGGSDAEGNKFVNVSGGITYSEKQVNALVQFVVNPGKNTFEFSAMEFNGVPQNALLANALLEKMCD
jgi:hypothetical protein